MWLATCLSRCLALSKVVHLPHIMPPFLSPSGDEMFGESKTIRERFHEVTYTHTYIYIYYIYIYIYICNHIYIYNMNLKACGRRVGFWRPIFQVQGWAFSMSSLQLLVRTTLVVWVSLPTSQEGVPRPSKYKQNTGKRIKIMGWNTIFVGTWRV